jgi:hypothetical protein
MKSRWSPTVTPVCTWAQQDDPDSNLWAASCGHEYEINDGSPEDNIVSKA